LTNFTGIRITAFCCQIHWTNDRQQIWLWNGRNLAWRGRLQWIRDLHWQVYS